MVTNLGGGGIPAPAAMTEALAEQRYAALRLEQAVRAGVVPPSVLNGHPNTYPAIWRKISQQVPGAAQAAGFKNPVAFLRAGGSPMVGGQGGVAGPYTPQAGGPPDVIERAVAAGAVPPVAGNAGAVYGIGPVGSSAGQPQGTMAPGLLSYLHAQQAQTPVFNGAAGAGFAADPATGDMINRLKMAMGGIQPGVNGAMASDPRIAALIQALAAAQMGGGGFGPSVT